MAEINVRTLMFNLGPEDAIDSTTSAKIACYTERKQLAYKLTDEGVLLLDGRGKKIHLKNGVVTLRNAMGLHSLPERIMTNVMREDVSLQGQRCCAIDSIGDNHVLTRGVTIRYPHDTIRIAILESRYDTYRDTW